jgi:4-amino-4-deoxy-L-arabinose transferase-like glycosyltransferase
MGAVKSGTGNGANGGRRFIRVALWLSVLGTVHALVILPLVSPHTTDDTRSYVGESHAILHGGYSVPVGPLDVTGLELREPVASLKQRDTYRTPGYGLFLALLGGGTGDVSRTLVLLVQAFLVGGAAFPLALWARDLFGARTALIATAVYALDPYTKRYAALVLSEALSTFLLMVAMLLFVRAWRRRSPALWAACGAVCGALTMVRSVFALTLVLVPLAVLVRRGETRWNLRAATVFAAVAMLFVAPWLAWTSVVNQRPGLQTFGVGWGLLAAAHGEGLGHPWGEVIATPAFERDFNSVHRLAPTAEQLRTDPNAFGRYLYRADAQQRKIATKLLRHRLRHEPLTVAGEYFYRAYFLWMIHEDWVQPPRLVPLLKLADWIVLAFALAGAAAVFRRRGPVLAIPILLIVYTVLSAVGHVEARYTIPLRGLYLPLATVGALPLVDRWWPRLRERLPDARRSEELLPRVLGATVVVFAIGSSAVPPLWRLGHILRWPSLLALCYLAVRWAWPRLPRPPRPGLAAWLGGGLALLAFLTAAWSIRPYTSFGRAGTLLVLLVTVAALGVGAADRLAQMRRLLDGILVATFVVAVAGLVLLPFDRAHTIQEASPQYPARYRGLGENPNTAALLLGVAMPLLVWRFGVAETRRRRWLLGLAMLVFVASIAASGSRGGLIEALAGVLALAFLAPGPVRRRAALGAVAVLVAAATVGVMRIPSAEGTGTATPAPATRDANRVLPLDGELGRGPLDRPAPPIRRSLLTSSGRVDAWKGAVKQAAERPVLGYGFGTEANVFVDRFYRFNSNSPENTFIGTLLQLGGLGVALLLGLLATLLVAGIRRIRSSGAAGVMVAAAASVVVAGIVAATTQSYLLAVGNLAVVPIWACAFLAAGRGAVARSD